MKTLLVITVGRTDVQLVRDDRRHTIDSSQCGVLHDLIKRRSWSVVSAPKNQSRNPIVALPLRENGADDVVLGIEEISSPALCELSDDAPRSFMTRRLIQPLPDGSIRLCTPKLDAVLEYLAPSGPSSALILETRREDTKDPRFAGEFLERRLCDLGVEDVRRVAFLTKNERLEDLSNDLDAVVRRTVVARLTDAVASATAHLGSGDRVVVATTGGFPVVAELVNEIVRVYCVGGPTVTALEVPDRLQQDDRAVPERFHPAASYRARWHALSLIEKGNLLGAWGAVSHLEHAPGQQWTRIVEWLAKFASSLPLPPECDLAELKLQRMAAKAALRVELALRAGDIPRAVHGTVAFFEAALWDHVLDHFERTGPKGRDPLRLKPESKPPAGKKLLRNDEPDEEEKKNCPFQRLEDGTYLFFEDGAGRFARDYIGSNHLKSLSDAINEVRFLRNDVAHNEPSDQLMTEASVHMQKAELWSSNNTFLSQPLVQAVLRELELESPSSLFENLFQEVKRRLIAA